MLPAPTSAIMTLVFSSLKTSFYALVGSLTAWSASFQGRLTRTLPLIKKDKECVAVIFMRTFLTASFIDIFRSRFIYLSRRASRVLSELKIYYYEAAPEKPAMLRLNIKTS